MMRKKTNGSIRPEAVTTCLRLCCVLHPLHQRVTILCLQRWLAVGSFTVTRVSSLLLNEYSNFERGMGSIHLQLSTLTMQGSSRPSWNATTRVVLINSHHQFKHLLLWRGGLSPAGRCTRARLRVVSIPSHQRTEAGRHGQWLVMLIPYLMANKPGHVIQGLIHARLQNRLQ